MAKSIVLFCFFILFFSCKNAEIPQDKILPQGSVAQKEKIRIKKISDILLQQNKEAYIGKIMKIKVDENRIFLLDGSLKQILMFSMEGEFIRALGRSGEGPGEFRYLYTMDVKDNLVACFDQGNLRLTLFDTSGVFIRSFGTQSQKSVPVGNCVAITQHHTILHCQQPAKLTKEQSLAGNYPWLICEFDTLGNVLSHHGKFNQQIVDDKIDKPFTEFKWSFPRFITSSDSQIYLYFYNIPIIVRYGKSPAVSKVFYVATPITKPSLANKNAEKQQHLSSEARRKLALQRMRNEHSIATHITDISYVDKYSILLVLQAKETRKGIDRTRAHYLSAYNVNTGHRLMTDMHIPSETPVMLQRIAVDADGFVYCIQNDQPDNFVIAKYEIVREEI